MKTDKALTPPNSEVQIYSASDLKYYVERSGHERFFFTRDSMKFFGDTMRNYGVRDAGDCWELYRRKPVKHGLQKSAFFDKQTFKRRFDKGE